MAIEIMSWVWWNSKQKGSALLMLLAIADNANHDGIAWPGIAYLARKTRLDERQAKRLVRQLAGSKEITIRRRFNNTNLFQFPGWKDGRHMGGGGADVTPTDSQPSLLEPNAPNMAGVVQMSPGGGADVTRGCHPDPQGVTYRSPGGGADVTLTVINHQETEQGNIYSETWKRALERLSLQLTTATFNTYLRDTTVIEDRSNGSMVVEVRTAMHQQFMTTRLKSKVEAALAEIGYALPVQFEARKA